MNLDSGSGVSHFNAPYYMKYKDEIEKIGIQDSMGMAGFGGTTRVATYKLDDICI